VYRAFTDPGQLAQWFGPAGCSVPRDSIEIDARPGGHLRFVMTAPDVRSPVDATFTDVVENELLAGEMEAAGVPGVAGPLRVHLRLEFHDEPFPMTSASLVTRSLTHGPVNPQAGTRRVPLGRNRAEGSAVADIDERFAAYVRDRGEHHLRVAVLLTGDWHAAEDLVQASLVKLYRAWPKLRGDGDPDAYLRRIMVNTHRSWWRARWRRETPAGELPETVIADFADGQALTAQVRQALQALPRQQRAVLVLRYYADLPEAEIADLLGCSPGTVKTHAHRGLRALRENFREDHYERHGN
jgi:RNA polymerase sigma-70 factor (sigma-E family)